eukprot:COSAG01_NODE_146_length_24099_cov_25.341208_25_plen_105_part_00
MQRIAPPLDPTARTLRCDLEGHTLGPQPAGAEQARTGRAAPAAKLGSFPFGARPHLALNNPIPTPVQTYLLSATVTRVCLAPAPCPIMHPFALVGHSAAALDRS